MSIDEESGVEIPIDVADEENGNGHNNSDDDVDLMKKDTTAKGERRYFALTLLSNFFFMVASILYVWLAVMDLDWQKLVESLPSFVLEADDDWTWYQYVFEDDYVFPAGNTWVSRYMIVYGVAAFLFIVTGFIDLFNQPGWLGIFFILAGGFGLASAMLVEKDEYLSSVFNCVSVHLFMLEAGGVLLRRHTFHGLKIWLRVADVSFLLGTLLDVILSYFIVFNSYTVPLAKLSIFASVMWLLCSTIYVFTTIYIQCHGGFKDEEEEDESIEDYVNKKTVAEGDYSEGVKDTDDELKAAQDKKEAKFEMSVHA